MKIPDLVKWCLLITNVSAAVPGLRRRQAQTSTPGCTCPANGPVTTTISSYFIQTYTYTATTQDGTVYSTDSGTTQVVTASSTTLVTVTTGTVTVTDPGPTTTITEQTTIISTVTTSVTRTSCTSTAGGATRKFKRQAASATTTASDTGSQSVITTVQTSASKPYTCLCRSIPQSSTLASSSTCSCPATTDSTVTVTSDYTSTSLVTASTTIPTTITVNPSTTTTAVVTSFVPASDAQTIETTADTQTVTVTSTQTRTTTSTATSFDCPTGTAAPLSCNATAYLIGTTNNVPRLYNINLATSYYFVVNGNVGNGAYTVINAMGYNVFDNYLYGIGSVSGNTYAIVRISATGNTREITRFQSSAAPTSGDIDTNGQYWFAASGGTIWYQYDLVPGSTTYGQQIDSGTTTLTGYGVYDFVYLPGQGSYMYSMAQSTAKSPTLSILRWSLSTHDWSVYKADTSYAAANPIIANWGGDNATIWGLASSSGQVIRQALSGDPVTVGTAPGTLTNADGARCQLTS